LYFWNRLWLVPVDPPLATVVPPAVKSHKTIENIGEVFNLPSFEPFGQGVSPGEYTQGNGRFVTGIGCYSPTDESDLFLPPPSR
jgi:hypothetical protein